MLVCLFRINLIKNKWLKNSGFVVSELVVGSGEQDNKINILQILEIAKHLKEPNDTNVEDKCLSLFESWMTKSKLSLAYYMFANKDVFYSKEFMIKVSMTSLLQQGDIQPTEFKFLKKK